MVYSRPGDAEHERHVDASMAEQQRVHKDILERSDEDRVYIITVTNTRTGASVRHNSRRLTGWYRTEDGEFLALQEQIDTILATWKAAGEDRSDMTILSGRQFREAEGKARLNPCLSPRDRL